MRHDRIIGFGWLLIGILGWYVLFLPAAIHAFDMYRADPGSIRISCVIMNGLFIRLVFSTIGIFAGYGIIRGRRWAKTACRVLSNLLLLDSLLELFESYTFYTSQGVAPGTGWVTARSVICDEVLFLFSGYSLVVLTICENSHISTTGHPAAWGVRRRWSSLISLCTENISKMGYLGLFSWFSLAAPFIASALCEWVFTHPWYHWGTYASIVFTRHYAFLSSSTLGLVALVADVGFRQWRLIWMPLAGLALTYLFHAWAAGFTNVF